MKNRLQLIVVLSLLFHFGNAQTCQDIPEIAVSDSSICLGLSTTLSMNYTPPSLCDMNITPNSIPLGDPMPGFSFGGIHNGHYYYVHNTPTTWTQGELICRQNGGYLVCINDINENNFVSNLTSNNIWIGMFRDPVTCNFRWLDCMNITFTNWRPGEPNSGPCGEPYVQIIRGCSFGLNTWNNLGNNSANGACYSNMVPIMEIDPAIYNNLANSNVSYLWSTGDTTAAISVSPSSTTDYWVDVSTANLICRKFITINVDTPNVSTTSLTSCDNYTWSVNGQTYTNSGLYSEVLQTALGCDSILNLDLTINASVSNTETVTACDNYTWSVNGQTYTNSGSYNEVLQTALGCDSIMILDLTINPSVSITETVTACDNYTWLVNGQTYTSSGFYSEVLQTALGCDSILNLDLTINSSVSTTETVTSCDDYIWSVNGQTYTNSGLYSEVLQTALGCDSVLHLDLNILNLTDTLIAASICDGDTFEIANTSYIQSGTYMLTTVGVNGCDSNITINLTVNELPVIDSLVIDDESCQDVNDGQVSIFVNSAALPLTYFWENQVNSNVIDNLSPGSYFLEIIDSNSCAVTENVEILPGSFISVDLGGDILVDYGTTITMNALVTGSLPENVVWQPSNDLSCSDCLSPLVYVEGERVFTIEVTDINGCFATDMVSVFVNERESFCLFPTAFSPNTDGQNDFFRSISNGVLAIQMSIYNRWGELVYSEDSNNHMQGWDGNYMGNKAPIGVYTYEARITYTGNIKEIITGSFTLFR